MMAAEKQKKYARTLFIFRRDLRLEDNVGLEYALHGSEEVVAAFIFDPRQRDAKKNKHFSAPAFYFLVNSLCELAGALKERPGKLFIFEGEAHKVVESLIKKDGIDAVVVNKDYTPFSRMRDKEIADVCEKHGAAFVRHDDLALSPIEDIRTGQGKPYTVFTPFMRKAMGYRVERPRKHSRGQSSTHQHNAPTLSAQYFSGSLKTKTAALADFKTDIDIEPPVHGGRKEALQILKKLSILRNYKDARNIPTEHGTSRLSAHHKFGTISIRETYHAALQFGEKHKVATTQFIAELYWRDFYYHIAYHFPYVFKKSFLPWAQNIEWINDRKQFNAWCEGKTGVPMVDAGMRELNQTGWMHNRSRMIVASYLTKNLLIDWHWGEWYFAQHLIDYDPAQNNGGWQWSASTGADPRPVRIFNPYEQAKKYDPGARYIKKWIPELSAADSKKLTDGKTQDLSRLAPGYPAPLVDQKESYRRALAAYKKAKNSYKGDILVAYE